MTLRYFVLAAAGQLALMATASGAAAPENAPGADPNALVRRVSQAYAAEMRGVVGLRTRTELTVDGPMYHRQTPGAPWYVYNDGELVSTSEHADARRPLVHDALRPEYLPEYRFSFAGCVDCEASEVAVAYDSVVHDAYHAHGYYVIDPAAERVRRSVEIPYQLPWPTHDGRLETTWGSTGDAWLPLNIVGTFVGKLGPFNGVAHYTQRLSPYERFPRVEAAVDALTVETGATPAPQPSLGAAQTLPLP